MSEFIRMYLTSFNSLGVNLVAFVVLLIVAAFFVAKDQDRLANIPFTLAIIVFFSSFLVLGASRYEIVSSAKWSQLYPGKDKISEIYIRSKDKSISQVLDTNVGTDTLLKIEEYQKQKHANLQTLTIGVTTESGKEEREVYLSRDNKLPKEMNRDNVMIEKIEYRKIEGLKRHLGSFYGNLEKPYIDGEIRITYKNDNSRPTVFED